MINIKDTSGGEHTVASSGRTNAALALGIIGTGLAGLEALNGDGGFLGIGGNGNGNSNYVNKDMYYRDLLNQVNVANAQFANVNESICALRERVGIGEVSNTYQNRISDLLFNNVETRFKTERQITDFEIQAAVCDFLPATRFIRPDQIGDPYHGVRLSMGHPTRPIYNPEFNEHCACV